MPWTNPILPLPVNHFPTIVDDLKYRRCAEFLETTTPEFLNMIFGDPVVYKKTYKLWLFSSIAVSGVVEPYTLVFNARKENIDPNALLNEIHTIYSILQKELKWPE